MGFERVTPVKPGIEDQRVVSPEGQPAAPVSRRGFLSGFGAAAGAAGAVALGPAEAVAQLVDPGTAQATRPDRFSRLFDRLPSFAEATRAVREALIEMGARGGVLDARDPLHEGPTRLITNPELSPRNSDNRAHTAGVTFFGQFLDHDMTFDTTSQLGVPTRPDRAPNSRTPALDLDSVYGRGPFEDPQLYDPDDRAAFKVEDGGLFEDLPRSSARTAIIADPRNDENLMIAGLHVAMLKFHNRVVEALRDDRSRSRDDWRAVYRDARTIVTWHYQWIIVHEFLPAIVGSALVNDILSRGRRFYRPRPGEQSIPVEFQGAAYRFGHSMVRPSYRANLAGDGGKAFFGFIFDPAGQGQADPVDLRGGARSARRFIGWQTFFNFGGAHAAEVRPNKTIDTRISTPLFDLPLAAIPSADRPTSLPQRNLLRHLTWSIPSGQAIASAMNIRPLGASQLRELARFDVNLERSTPLWYYVLREAQVLTGGQRLAGVGARIVAEVFLGLLAVDPRSYFSQRRWRPTLPSRVRGTFGIVDLLNFAQVDPDTRKQ
jgi:Animal haem peroxidase